MPLPVTSPITTPSRSPGSTNASYQSPPTSAAETGGLGSARRSRDRASRGSRVGSSPRWSSTAMRCSCSCSCARRMTSEARSAASRRSARSAGRRTTGRSRGHPQRADPAPVDPRIGASSQRRRRRDSPSGAFGTSRRWCGAMAGPRAAIVQLHLGRIGIEQSSPGGARARRAGHPATRLDRLDESLEPLQTFGLRLGLGSRGLFEQQIRPGLLRSPPRRSHRPTARAAARRQLGPGDRRGGRSNPRVASRPRGQSRRSTPEIAGRRLRGQTRPRLQHRRQRRSVLGMT